MWFGVASRTDIKRHVFHRDWTMCLNYATLLSSIVNIIGGTYMTM